MKLLSTACEHASGYDRIHEWCLNAQDDYEKNPTGVTKEHFTNMA